jgi:uncharacterized protein YciI
MRKIAFFYFMKNEPDKIKSVAGHHSEYWISLKLMDYSGGPFSDRSGGMIIFCCDSIDAANELIQNDPFIKNHLIENYWLKMWDIY